MNDLIKKEQLINQPIDKVWAAITEAEKISTWFIKADFKAEVGAPYTFSDAQCEITGRIIKVDPTTNLIYTWKLTGKDAVTTVSWKLEETKTGTKLVLEHTGISNYPGESAIAIFSAFDDGWNDCLTGLVNYLTK